MPRKGLRGGYRTSVYEVFPDTSWLPNRTQKANKEHNQPTTEKKHTKKPTNKFPQVSYPIMADYKVIPASLNRFRNRVSSIPSPSSTFTGKDLSVAVKIHSHQVFCKNSLLCYQRALYRVSYYSKFQMNNLKFQLEANKMIAKLQSREGGFGKIHLTASSSSPSAYHRLLRGK